ncbi:MAG: DUF58 domain-containing protein [Proteobacteria bacterium]|nr:DUF58 domain-containing protein [Pseudomonadota bacterium]
MRINKAPNIHVSLESLIQLRHHARNLSFSNYKRVHSELLGDHFSRLRGRGIDFDEVRIYTPGDDIRHMDWRVTARTGKPHTKLYCEERERPVYLLLDYNPSMYFGTRVTFKSTIASEAAALLGWAAIQQGNRLGAMLFSDGQHIELRPKSRLHGILPLLKNISAFSKPKSCSESPHGMMHALSRLSHVTKPGSLIFILSDFFNCGQDMEYSLRRLSEHNTVIACAISDPLEINPPPPNFYAVTDGKEIFTFDSSSNSFRKNYQKQFNDRRSELQTLLKKQRIPLIEMQTDQSVVKTLQKHLRN